ncbi:13811_t:CDS:2 [Dentiscutata erythropus]|uniref:13811_t:CDS:1 n=1 Tax=Dentiscutata erythropus TaxID=1348616 RepID=A0A9N8VF22_9GLOM|nr:13811_t:CDS:2 [Dentiscutata erythropus]
MLNNSYNTTYGISIKEFFSLENSHFCYEVYNKLKIFIIINCVILIYFISYFFQDAKLCFFKDNKYIHYATRLYINIGIIVSIYYTALCIFESPKILINEFFQGQTNEYIKYFESLFTPGMIFFMGFLIPYQILFLLIYFFIDTPTPKIIAIIILLFPVIIICSLGSSRYVLAFWIKLAILLSKEGLDSGLKIAVIVFGVLVLIGFCGILSGSGLGFSNIIMAIFLIFVTLVNNDFCNDFENVRFESEIKTVVANVFNYLDSLKGEGF